MRFTAYSTNAVIFQGFTPEYFKYLAEKNDSAREVKARAVRPNSTMDLSDIERTFGFIREDDCYHDFSVAPIASINSVESGEVWRRIAGTFKKLSS